VATKTIRLITHEIHLFIVKSAATPSLAQNFNQSTASFVDQGQSTAIIRKLVFLHISSRFDVMQASKVLCNDIFIR